MVINDISFQLLVIIQEMLPKMRIPNILQTIDLIHALERVSRAIFIPSFS